MAQGILEADIRRPVDQVGQIFAAERLPAKGLTETVQPLLDPYDRPVGQQSGNSVPRLRYPANAPSKT
jgi:hypothetical protein